ncbi:MAG: type II toxin-antitoxin system HicA family toxin [Acidobacteriaceae bacterium]|nr:type II toxin-antitoxin system HicA family toxin [Acidobacteriaceae bacterium]MBV9037894.1 type II toxin-antitoxin system HicA family toxin [Acidobacteriaceae bacterium]
MTSALKSTSWELNEGCDVLKLLEQDGWKLVRTTGIHRHYRHATKPGTVTVP